MCNYQSLHMRKSLKRHLRLRDDYPLTVSDWITPGHVIPIQAVIELKEGCPSTDECHDEDFATLERNYNVCEENLLFT